MTVTEQDEENTHPAVATSPLRTVTEGPTTVGPCIPSVSCVMIAEMVQARRKPLRFSPKLLKTATGNSSCSIPLLHVHVKDSPHLPNLCEIKSFEENFSEGYDSNGNVGPFANLDEVEGEHFLMKMCCPSVLVLIHYQKKHQRLMMEQFL
mmetsp:Transcript_64674/g.75894  ORF Transcript_64674/g.75894 Transcript_64674/m.75894 type:complete len:150 (+) Transcript_64674:45-494(+)